MVPKFRKDILVSDSKDGARNRYLSRGGGELA